MLIGVSRKRSLGRMFGDAEATTGTTAASIGAAIAAYKRGATIMRAHDVREHAEALQRRRRGTMAVGRAPPVGFEVFGYHGVNEDERRPGGRPSTTLARRVGHRAETDRLEDTVDYRQVVAVVREVSDRRQFGLLEALAGAVADALLRALPVGEYACGSQTGIGTTSGPRVLGRYR